MKTRSSYCIDKIQSEFFDFFMVNYFYFCVTGRKLDFQGDRVREGFKGRVPAGNGVGPL